MPITQAPDTLKRLVETFDRNLDTYRTTAYNEMQIRRDFIDPFFEAYGWDNSNPFLSIGDMICRHAREDMTLR